MYLCEVVPDFDFSSAAFRALFEKSGASAFQHALWQQAMARHVAALRGAEPCTLVISATPGAAPCFVLPLIRRRIGPFRVLEYANFGLVDYAAPVIDPACQESLLADPELPAAIRSALPRHDLLWIKHIRTRDCAFAALFAKARLIPAGFSGHAAELGDEFATWRLQGLSANRRGHINRKRKAMAREGAVHFAILSDPQEIERAFASLRAFRARRFEAEKGHDYMQNAASFRFYRDLAISGAQSGFALSARLSLNDVPVAVVFGLLERGRYYYLLPGADYARFGAFSPGQVMLDHLIEAVIDRGGRVFDFTIGDEGYKASFGTVAEPIATLAEPRGALARLGLPLALWLRERLRRRRQGRSDRSAAIT
ncbi:MAG: GNAT family N-acetyltransferase [Rhizobiales bacterium]|nr:GNAT family N-acetyltransferase [Hyphomicrobiales bacterium]